MKKAELLSVSKTILVWCCLNFAPRKSILWEKLYKIRALFSVMFLLENIAFLF